MSKFWNFPLSNHGLNYGDQGEGAGSFINYRLNNLAREIIQNSLDARKDSNPVIVEFHLFSTEASDFPGIESFFEYVMGLKAQYKGDNVDPKAKVLIKNTITALNAANSHNKITWLRISDKNTTGMWGSSTPGNQETAWFAFVNGVGKNQKGENSGGSRGKGKASIFINSAINTLFVSTCAQNPNSKDIEKAHMGVTRLLSLNIDDGSDIPDYTQGVGYCVEDDENAKKYNLASNGYLEIDPEFDRDAEGTGTDIYIPFFMEDDNWDDVIATESIISFLPAIMADDLRIVISYDNTTVKRVINYSNLTPFINGQSRAEKEAKLLYNVLSSKDTKVIKYESKPGFEMSLYLLQDNVNGTNNVYEYRVPPKMKIRKEPKESSVGYNGILFIEGDEISKRLRSIEDETHSNWYINRYKESGYERIQILEALNTLDDFVSSECQKLGMSGSEESVYFDVRGWNSEDDNYDMSVEEKKDFGLPTKEVTFDTKKDTNKNPSRKPLKRKGNEIDDSGSADANVEDTGTPGTGNESYSHPEGHNNGRGGEIHSGKGTDNYDPDKGEKILIGRRTIATAKCGIPAKDMQDGLFDLIFIPQKTGTDVEIEILKSGTDSGFEETKILSASLNGKTLNIEKNKIHLDKINKDAFYRINLKLDEHSNFTWEVNINAEE